MVVLKEGVRQLIAPWKTFCLLTFLAGYQQKGDTTKRDSQCSPAGTCKYSIMVHSSELQPAFLEVQTSSGGMLLL